MTGGEDVKVKVLRDFRDRTAELKVRKKGETLEVSKDRAEKLTGLGLGEIIPEKQAKQEKG